MRVRSVIDAWLAHLYTASGALCAFLAMNRIFYDRYRDAFFWLAVALVIDATDGFFARGMKVRTRIPWFDGGKLDEIVDYLTYVFVPAFFVWHALLVPERWSMVVVAAMLFSSLYGFCRVDAKTSDQLFTGFPSYWNVAVFYLYLGQWAPATNAAILTALAALVFAPMHYVYPSRTPTWRTTTLTLGAVWAGAMFVLVGQMPDVSNALLWASLAFPAYYVVLSIHLERRRRSQRIAT
jgi:phosphatidylcholine synthase